MPESWSSLLTAPNISNLQVLNGLGVEFIFPRKLLSAYVASFAVILFFALHAAMHQPAAPYAARHFAGMGTVVAVYAVPIVFIYGVAVSALTDYWLSKLQLHRYIEFAVSGLTHAAFGFIFGGLFGSIAFCIYGGGAAALFFLVDCVFKTVWTHKKKAAAIIGLVVPVVIFAGATGYWYAAAAPPPLTPFTEKDAVQFAVSGRGTVIDVFPREAGIHRLEIDEYQVERETSVAAAGQERYEVTFTERWSKAGATGQRRMNYRVGRGWMEAHGGDGDYPPYKGELSP